MNLPTYYLTNWILYVNFMYCSKTVKYTNTLSLYILLYLIVHYYIIRFEQERMAKQNNAAYPKCSDKNTQE